MSKIEKAESASCDGLLFELAQLRVAVDDDVRLRCEYQRAERALAAGDKSAMRVLCRTLEQLTGESYCYEVRFAPIESAYHHCV